MFTSCYSDLVTESLQPSGQQHLLQGGVDVGGLNVCFRDWSFGASWAQVQSGIYPFVVRSTKKGILLVKYELTT